MISCISIPQVNFQAILSTDGNVSFAIFIYDNESIDAIGRLSQNYLVGFDAGDEIKGTTVQNQVSSHQNLENVNIFRIDGNW